VNEVGEDATESGANTRVTASVGEQRRVGSDRVKLDAWPGQSGTSDVPDTFTVLAVPLVQSGSGSFV
jgi:hypothetical protein